MTAYSKNNTIKGTIHPATFDELVIRDQKITAMKNELHKVSTKKPDKAIYQPKEKKT